MIDRRIARTLQVAVLCCADAALAAIFLVVAHGQGQVFGLVGAGAVAGVVTSGLAVAAVLARSRGLGGATVLLSWLRPIAVPVAAGLIAVRSGAGALNGLTEKWVLAGAMLDALAGVVAAVAAWRVVGD